MSSKRLNIWIAEDDQDDRLLIEDAFIANGVSKRQILFIADGEELLDRLNADGTLPGIILLDLNMPRKDGREALKEIRSQQVFKHIPIIIFTTSNSEEDIRLAYQQGSNTYITKPNLYSDLVDTTGIIKKYWFEKAALAS